MSETSSYGKTGLAGTPAGAIRRREDTLTLRDVHTDFTRETYSSGLDFGKEHAELTATFIAALATKPFVLFSGLSGSGKTRLATALGQWFGRDHLLIQPVRPDWTSPEAVLGFENPNSDTSETLLAWTVPRVLEFVLTAARDPDQPYLLVLDEMNLAHVEQYFADVLSGMESGQPIVPNLQNDGRGWRLPPKDGQYIPWPDNLYLVGTVNIDETTYRFSPKVLDRATSIEFRVPPGALKNEYPEQSLVARGHSELMSTLLRRSRSAEPAWRGRNQLAHSLQHLHRLLYEFDAEFGHRVFRDSLRFGCQLGDTGLSDFRVALDLVVLYKILPKIEMDTSCEYALIEALTSFAAYGPGRHSSLDPLATNEIQPVLPRSFSKIRRLARARKRAGH